MTSPMKEALSPEPAASSTHAATAEWMAKHMPRRKKRIAWYRKNRSVISDAPLKINGDA